MTIIKDISIVFISIFLEAMPFVLLGAIISSIIEHFISDDMIEKLIPKNAVLGSLFGILLGFFIPACDCAVIPISKRLIKKKVPINVAVSFMLASPIINPVVIMATYSAFNKVNPKIFYARTLGGIVVSLIIGILMGIKFKGKDILKVDEKGVNRNGNLCECHNESHCHCSCHHEHNCECIHESNFSEKNKTLNALSCILEHTIKDFIDVLKFLILGAFIASLVQVFIPKNVIQIFASNKVLSIIVLMIFAYIISLCSTSDSFVGKSLLGSFGESGVIAYLLLGPMVDLKNTFVLFGNYKKKFVVTLISVIFIIVFLAALILGGILW